MELDLSTASLVQVELQPTKRDDCYSTMENKQRLLHQYEERLSIAKLHNTPSVKKLLQQCEDHLISEYGKQYYLAKCIDDISDVDKCLSVNPSNVYLWERFIYRLCLHHILFSQDGNNLRDITSIRKCVPLTTVDICSSYTCVVFFNDEMTTSECMDSIEITWRHYPSLRHLIKLSYTYELIHSHDEFICNNIRYIVSIYKDELHQLLQSYHHDRTNFDALVKLLYFTILYDYRECATIVISLLNTIHFDNYKSKIDSEWIYYNFSDIDELFFQFDKFIEVLEQLKYGPILKLGFIYHCYRKFGENNDTKKLQVIIQHKTFILSEIEASHGETIRYFKLLSFLTISSDQTSNIKSILLKLKQDKHRFYDIKTVFCFFHLQLKEYQCSFLSKTVDIFLTYICENQSYNKLQALLEYSASLHHNYDENYIELLNNHQELILSMEGDISTHGNCRDKALYCEVVLCLICGFHKTCQTENKKMSLFAINKVKKSLSDHQKYCFGECLQMSSSRIGDDCEFNYTNGKNYIIEDYRAGYRSLGECLVKLCEAETNFNTSICTSQMVNDVLIKFIMHEDEEHRLLNIIDTMCEFCNSETKCIYQMGKFICEIGMLYDRGEFIHYDIKKTDG